MASPPPSVSPDQAKSSPGSQSALRTRNIRRIAERLRVSGPATQTELAESTGLSGATVSNLIHLMAASGTVELEPTTHNGRRATRVRLSSGRVAVAGVDIGRRHVRVVIASLGYRVVAEQAIPLPRGHQAAEAIAKADEVLGSLLAAAGLGRADLLGVGVGLPGPIDAETGTVEPGTVLPEWIGVDLAAIGARLGCPVYFDNDANLGALSEVTWGARRGVRHLVFVKIGAGIGTGLVLAGTGYAGSSGIAGEIGHSPFGVSDLACPCGRVGCLETVASAAAMAARLSERAGAPVGVDEFVERCRSGVPEAVSILDQAGDALGRALGTVGNLLNPDVFVVGGPLAGLGDLYLPSIRRGMAATAIDGVLRSGRLVTSSLGERAEALGATVLVMRNSDLAAAVGR